MNTNTATADQVEGNFHKIVSRIAFAVVHHASSVSHAIIVERGATNAKLLVDFNVHFLALVIPSGGNNLEGFIEAVRDEHRAINILLEVGSH